MYAYVSRILLIDYDTLIHWAQCMNHIWCSFLKLVLWFAERCQKVITSLSKNKHLKSTEPQKQGEESCLCKSMLLCKKEQCCSQGIRRNIRINACNTLQQNWQNYLHPKNESKPCFCGNEKVTLIEQNFPKTHKHWKQNVFLQGHICYSYTCSWSAIFKFPSQFSLLFYLSLYNHYV